MAIACVFHFIRKNGQAGEYNIGKGKASSYTIKVWAGGFAFYRFVRRALSHKGMRKSKLMSSTTNTSTAAAF